MVSREEHRLRVAAQLAGHLLRTGLADASLRQLAAAAGISDRMLLYYFHDKADVLATTLDLVAMQLAGKLDAAIPEGALAPGALISRAAVIVLDAEMRPYMRLWVQVVAAAARQEAPFTRIAEQVVAGFMQWIEARLAPDAATDQPGVAAAILAIIDGVALLDVCAGPELSARAVAALSRLVGGPEAPGP